eukprot:UN25618
MALTADALHLHALEIYGCLLSSLIISFVLVMWASFIILRSWRKKFLELYYDAPTFYYHHENVNIGGSFRFIGTMLSYLITGGTLTYILILSVLLILSSKHLWMIIVFRHWDFWVGYLLYCAFVLLVAPSISKKLIEDGDFVKAGMEPYFKVIAILFELSYMPLAILYGILTFCYGVLMVTFSFYRPDTLILPRGFEGVQTGHIVFIMNVKL